ncbi:MAG: hypothetical protein MJZ57_03125 [Bacteroidales bacterium]|nr:hypothetical protein [Bacteroidales bacterium]
MRKTLLLLGIAMVLLAGASAQGSHRIQYRADMGFYDEDYMPGAQRLIGNVAFAQGNVRGYCDSAYLFDRDNYIIAYGDRVKILVGDSVKLYGRRAYYDADDKIASIAANVRLEKGKAYLVTDSLVYDMNIDCGYFLTGGKIVNDEDTLTSVFGRYYTKTDDAYANKDVRLNSSSYHMDCDSLKYNANVKVAYFISPTHLLSEDNEIFTDRGWYDTEHDVSTLVGEVKLFSDKQTMTADSVYYDKVNHFGRAWHGVEIVDTAQNYIVKGNYIEHHENGGWSMATDSNLLILIDDNQDSLYLHSDTLKVLFDDSNDLKLALAYFHAKFYRSDIQGACDSMSCVVEDSVLNMFYNPVVWSEDYQMTADTIRYSAIDSINSKVELCKAGFVVGGLYGATEFNQIKGINITGYLHDQDLYRVDVVNNAECVYYVQEEDSSLIGINTSITSEMRVFLEDNKIQQIRFYDAPDGKIYPDEQFEEKDRKLQDFRWLDEYRPKKIQDIFANPIPRSKE